MQLQKRLLNHDRTQIKQKLADLWLDEAIMEPSKKDDYLHVEAIVKKFGKNMSRMDI